MIVIMSVNQSMKIKEILEKSKKHTYLGYVEIVYYEHEILQNKELFL